MNLFGKTPSVHEKSIVRVKKCSSDSVYIYRTKCVPIQKECLWISTLSLCSIALRSVREKKPKEICFCSFGEFEAGKIIIIPLFDLNIEDVQEIPNTSQYARK